MRARRPSSSSDITVAQKSRLLGLYSIIALLHVYGWWAYLHYASHSPTLAGLGLVAYTLGLRHGFDADHIAAVDNAIRYTCQTGEQPLDIGFFFSLGHSTIVFCLACAVALAGVALKRELPVVQGVGYLIGTLVSGTFLSVVGILNISSFLASLRPLREPQCLAVEYSINTAPVTQRSIMNRILGRFAPRFTGRGWRMYPLGLLFGLGFDTASEVALLVITATASATKIPLAAVLSLPVLFAAGMTAVDTTDGALMCRAYHWALINPLRRAYYNLVLTGLSILVALGFGIAELLQLSGSLVHSKSQLFRFASTLRPDLLGCVVVGLFIVIWCGSSVHERLSHARKEAP